LQLLQVRQSIIKFSVAKSFIIGSLGGVDCLFASFASTGSGGMSPGNNVRPDAFKKLLLLTDMVKGLLLPNYEDKAMNSISCEPTSRSFIRKLTLQN